MRIKEMQGKGGKSKNRIVQDRQGGTYELAGKLSEGGQGIVCRTGFPNVLVKVGRHPATDPRTKAWFDHVQWVSRLPLDKLKIAKPQTLIVKPRFGYVMELMDGLVPLGQMMEGSFQAVHDGHELRGFIESGGLSKRLRLLTGLCATLAELHGRGLAFGDLAPGNIFVSQSCDHAEVWLIDCDNISVFSREGGQKLYTPDYGAPEIIRGESGINSLTDSWSVGVIAFQLLTLLHPLKGDVVTDGEAEDEERALAGERPWVDDADDDSNRASSGLPRDLLLTKELQRLFQQCFGPGRNDPDSRPTLSEWRAAFEAAAEMLMVCDSGDGCGSSFYCNRGRQCPFCNRIQDEKAHLLMTHYLYAPLSDEERVEYGLEDPWIRTEHRMVLGKKPVELRDSPVSSATYSESAPLCTLVMADDGLYIEPNSDKGIALQSQGTQKTEVLKKKMRLRSSSRRGDHYMLHLADSGEMHYAWRFKW